MSNHITINGQTFASVEEMPPDVRRQYESAMQLLARNAAAAGSGSDADVNISTDSSDPAHRSFKTVTRMTSSRILVNGKEYHHLEDVPAEIRSALANARGLQDATLSPAAMESVARSSKPTQISRTPATGSLQDTTFDPSSSVTLRRITLLVLLLLTFLAGALIGALADAFIGGKFLR